MITALEAKEIIKNKKKEKLNNFLENKKDIFDRIEKEIVVSANQYETKCRVALGWEEVEFNSEYYEIILNNLGYKVRLDKGILYISWE